MPYINPNKGSVRHIAAITYHSICRLTILDRLWRKKSPFERTSAKIFYPSPLIFGSSPFAYQCPLSQLAGYTSLVDLSVPAISSILSFSSCSPFCVQDGYQ